MKTSSILVLAACTTVVSAAHGALLLQENFDALGTGGLGGQNSWTAESGLTVAEGGLSYSGGDIQISGGAKHAQWGSGLSVQPLGYKTFDPQSSDVWFSLTIQVNSTDTNSRFWFYVSDDQDLGNSGVVGQINTNSTALLAGYRATNSQFVSGSTSLPLNSTLFIVAKFSQGGISPTAGDYDKMEVWVNPTSTSLGVALTATNSTGSLISSGIDTFAITSLIANTGAGASVKWDNLRIGTDRADVLDVYSTSQIPEPSAFAALAGLAGLGFAASRRRRV